MENPTNNSNNKTVLPQISFKGKVHLITSDEALRQLDQELSLIKQFGFDTETKPSFKKGDVFNAALLQLATESTAYLIRLHHITDFQIIKNILENENVVKVGVAIRDDIKLLQKTFKFDPKNFVELQTLAKAKGLKNYGLKGMTEEALQATVSKGPKMTNWEILHLSDRQINYAATDAWIGFKLYQFFNNV